MATITKIEELRGEAKALLDQAREIQDAAKSENRSMTGEEVEKQRRIMADFDAKRSEIDLEERAAGLDTPEERVRGERGMRLPVEVDDEEATPEEREAVNRSETPEYRQAFRHYLIGGDDGLSWEQRQMLTEVRAMTEGVDSDGGFLAPASLAASIQRDALDLEQLAPRMSTINASVRAIRQIKGVDTIQFQWVAERAQKPEDSPTFDRTEIVAHTAAVIVRISDELLEDSQFDIEGYLSPLAAEAKVEGEEAAFVAGSGNGQPWGILTRLNAETNTPNRYSTQGVGTLAADDLVRALYALRPRHRRTAAFVLGTQAMLAARLMKDTTNQYIWQPGLQAGQPDRILGKPAVEAVHDALDNPIAGGNDVGLVGDLRRYTVLRRLQLQVKRLEELYAETDEIGLRFRFRTGGDVQNNAAFRSIHVKAA
jgi:HK97 family phage major capsid protein